MALFFLSFQAVGVATPRTPAIRHWAQGKIDKYFMSESRVVACERKGKPYYVYDLPELNCDADFNYVYY